MAARCQLFGSAVRIIWQRGADLVNKSLIEFLRVFKIKARGIALFIRAID